LADLLRDDPDLDLVPAAAGGDLDAFEALVRRYQSRIIGLARSYTRNTADAEDLAQEVFVRLYRSLGQFRGESLFRTWLYRIALNLARSHHARRDRQQAVWGDSGAADGESFDPAAEAPTVEATLVRREAIERALAELPEDLREVVMLRDVHGLDYREIAQATGAPMGTVESRIFRARQRLRVALAPLVDEPG
jgi:RNA polymerase sigma-70 factor (ECF subfamily)